MPENKNSEIFAKIENEAKTYLKGDKLRIALELLDYLKESGREWICDWHPEFYYMGELTCLIAISKPEPGEDDSWNLCLWQHSDDIYEPNGLTVGEDVKEFARNHVWNCIHCGGCDVTGGGRRTVFGKEFTDACCNVFQIINPDDEMLKHIKVLMDLQKRVIADSKKGK